MPDATRQTLSDVLVEASVEWEGVCEQQPVHDICEACETSTLLLRAAQVAKAAERLRDEPHRVVFHDSGWELEHNLPCRIEGMRNCLIHERLKDWPKPEPDEMGRFDVKLVDGDLTFVRSHETDPAKDLVEALSA